MSAHKVLRITLEFSSGAESLFGGAETEKIVLDGKRKWTVQDLLRWMVANILTTHTTNFLKGRTVRPGILVLVNETDWEVVGQLKYVLQDKDHVVFIASSHAG